MFLLLTIGAVDAWGQTKVADGIYYIRNNNSLSYGYLWPSITTNSTTGYRYLTTSLDVTADAVTNNNGVSYPAHDKSYSHWVVKNITGGYIQLINPRLNKYVVLRKFPKANNTKGNEYGDRDVWLTDEPAAEDIEYTYFVLNNNDSPYKISPKAGLNNVATTTGYSFNSASGNSDRVWLTWSKTDNKPQNGEGREGLIQLYSGGTPAWSFTSDLLDAPEISDVNENSIVTVTDANGLPDGYHIRYTTDDTNPTASSPIMEGRSFLVTSSLTLKAVVERYGIVLTNVATKALEPAPCAAPVITFDNTTSKVSITCTTAGSTIYYTIDGNTPTASSTAYSIPFSVTSPTTVKAIATHATFATSDVGELAISQVATPTIQNNGNNAISITTTTPGATIYYTSDGSTPTTSSTEYIGPLTNNVSNVTIKAIAVKEGMITSTVGSGSVKLQCATPVITRVGLTFSLSCSKPTDANLYYTLGGGSETLYSGPVAFAGDQLPMTVTAVARHNDYTQSETASMEFKNGTGTPDDPYLIYGATDFTNFVTNVNNGTTASACYKLGSDVSAGGIDAITTTFTGTFDGSGYTISNLGNALFNSVNGGTVKNVILDAVRISGGTNAGAIANKVIGTSSKKGSVYNCGVLSGSISGSGFVGSIVGQLGDSNNDNCYARVINCYSYATVGGGSDVGGIVGYNCFATTATNIRTMVMNCMFYGDIESGTNVSPVYGGENINNLQGGLNTFNYYAFSQLTTATITKYNCALAVEEKYLNRFEFYRLLLNSNKKLAAFYATGSHDNANQKMMKWVLETADRTIEKPKPYPVLKAQGYYPSIINPDFENAPDSASVGRNHGGKLRKTLSVTISSVGSNAPTGARITTGTLTLQRTDKDFDRFNFNYDKVQLPYYNDVGTGNYTGNRVVTGWKITAITAVTNDPYTAANYDYTKTYASNQTYFDYPNYNFADRKSSNKDLYSVSGRVFSQGAYFDVPYGVSSITIEPYWGKACYIADQNYDVVYKNDYTGKQNVSQTGTQVTVGTTKFNGQNVQKSIEPALNYIANDLGGLGSTVYDNALVLVGNLHLDVVPLNGNRPFTMMSVDMDNDHEPDYSLIYHHKNRSNITPIRFDFLTVPGTAQAQKPNGASLICNFTIFKTRGWFEVTNTAFMYSSQIEYENGALYNKDEDVITKIDAPLILLGGVFDQFVSTQSSTVDGHTIYIHVGSNVWINSLGLGTHSDGSRSTPHVPVSVTGGEYEGFYLTGTYNANATVKADNAECYISGGHFAEAAGASLEQINGNVRWQIYNADIDNFFGGGINDAKPVLGNVTTDIFNSNVTLFCGGPKFGNMQGTKTVTTYAEGCTFGKYFGAGYGGTSLSKKKYYDTTTTDWSNWAVDYTTDRGNYFDGATTPAPGKAEYGKKGVGVATDLDYEFFVWSSGATGGRFYVKFASFSLAQCNDVSSTLKKCTVETNFYGGGNLGKVVGTATSVLEDCTVKGSVYGAGYSASLPTVEVRDAGFAENPNYNSQSGMFEPATLSSTTTFTWQNAAAAGKTLEDGKSGSDLNSHILYTNTALSNLGEVANTVLTITGNTTVGESVYGGGEESGVGGNTTVNVTGGTIGTTSLGGATYGNVYGGGKGKEGEVTAGLVKGNTNITISGSPTILHNIYGGGAYGSVGTFTYNATSGMPTALATENTGKTAVTITGGTIGTNGDENGMVFGSSRGDVATPGTDGVDPNDRMAWVYSTHVTIGDTSKDTSPLIKGSVYGSGENGHTFQNTIVDIKKGTIGIATGMPIGEYSGAKYPYRGNVFGGGCGTDTYWIDANDDGVVDDGEVHYNPLAGIVQGNSTVNITGGHVVHNVYGAGAMGSVGSASDATSGKTTVNISGGRVGHDGERNGNVFGAARGEYGISTAESNLARVRESEVNIIYPETPSADNGSKTEQLIAGSVFGGGESGLVSGNVTVKMTGGLLLKDIYGGSALANTQTGNWDNSANGGAGGWAAGKTSASATTTVRLTGGTILGEAFGGGLGEAGKPAYVYGDVLLDLNGTTTSGETGTAIAKNARGCAVREVFGCNNAAGTPMGHVLVHVYATQNKDKSQIANTDGETPKVKDTYDMLAVYGGGNLAAYEPYGGKNTTYSTNVIIDGCGLTSIRQVYGGGNAASTPATNVTVNGTFEIEELFGGGNGKDNILINGVEMPNPGANVGYKNYSVYYQEEENGPWKVKDADDADTKAERLSSDYVYGTGKASVNLYGGTVHRVFGGSNTKGNVRLTAVTLLDEEGECTFCVDEAYGGGKSALMDAEAQLLMACIPGLQAVYGGAEAADVHGNVTLNITNGTFDRVFGGNNESGTIGGAITINVEEIGCRPVKIGELYGGGNQAAYSVYGYDSNGKAIESGTTPIYDDPQINVMSFTSIGQIFGGGYGSRATLVGNPTVNVNVAYGKYYNDEESVVGENVKTPNDYPIPSHAKGKMGAISNVFGGGNAAKVIGNTNVNIATLDEVYVVKQVSVGEDVSSYYTRNNDGTYTSATGNAVDGTTYYEKLDVLGVDIRGNVYGGGNNAEVTGNSKVKIGKKDEGE